MKCIEKIEVYRMPDNDPDPSYLEQEGFEDRLDQYKRGVFGYMGIVAKAEVVIDGICQTITSGGLWGIEDDSDEGYLNEIAQEQLNELSDQLEAIGFPKRQLLLGDL